MYITSTFHLGANWEFLKFWLTASALSSSSLSLSFSPKLTFNSTSRIFLKFHYSVRENLYLLTKNETLGMKSWLRSLRRFKTPSIDLSNQRKTVANFCLKISIIFPLARKFIENFRQKCSTMKKEAFEEVLKCRNGFFNFSYWTLQMNVCSFLLFWNFSPEKIYCVASCYTNATFLVKGLLWFLFIKCDLFMTCTY